MKSISSCWSCLSVDCDKENFLKVRIDKVDESFIIKLFLSQVFVAEWFSKIRVVFKFLFKCADDGDVVAIELGCFFDVLCESVDMVHVSHKTCTLNMRSQEIVGNFTEP